MKLVILVSLLIVFSSCKKEDNNTPIDTSIFPSQFLSVLENNEIYITSFGQSIDIEDITTELDALAIDYTRDNYLTHHTVNNNSVILMVIGCSIKGLQEAGTTVEAENDRALAFIDKKETKNLTFIAFHIGGIARRGKTSDGIITSVMSHTDFNVVYKPGDYDQTISKLSNKHSIPMFGYESPTQLLPTLRKMINGEEQ